MQNSFYHIKRTYYKMDPFPQFRRQSKGYMNDGPARVHPNILFGAGCMLTPEFIRKHQITHVINCANDCDTPEWIPEQYKSNYTCLKAVDSFETDITAWYGEFENTLNRFLRSSDCKNVYIHCQAGINRSGFLTLLYCCAHLKYTFESACKSILMQRPCALTNHVFYNQVKEYIKNHN